MVSGGTGQGGRLDSVELLNMNGSWICPMPKMPQPRSAHTQSGPIACGGYKSGSRRQEVRQTCDTFFSGGEDWVRTHTLAQERYSHSAWASPRGLMLLGGVAHSNEIIENERTTEILTEDGETTPGFTLNYWT